MNYQLHYNLLIKRAKTRKLSGYGEWHHIVPKCMKGTDDPSNLAHLTAREHYVAHQLLVKIYPGNCKLVYAAKCMTISSHAPNRSSNRLYGWLREQHSKIVKECYKTLPNYGMKGKQHSNETRRQMVESHSVPAEKVTCPKCNKIGGVNNMMRYHFDNCGKGPPKTTCPHCRKTGSDNIMKRWHFDNCKNRITNL